MMMMMMCQARKARVTWVNGIAYHMDHMTEGGDFISRLFGGEPIRFCYNPTKQAHIEDTYGYLSDLTQAGTQKLGVVTAEVNTLAQFLRESVAAVGRNGVVVHIAHSQGALITALASRQLTPLEMSQIEILAFGGAAAIRKTAQTPFRRCVNYYSVNDPLLFVVPSAAQALRSGLVSNEEFVFLMPRLGDPIADHNLIGPTYAQALEWEGKRFQLHHRSMAHRTLRPGLMVLLAVASNVSRHLDEALKRVIRKVMQFLVALYAIARKNIGQFNEKLREKILKPLVLFLKIVFEWLLESKRIVTGEEKFVPVSPQLMDASSNPGVDDGR